MSLYLALSAPLSSHAPEPTSVSESAIKKRSIQDVTHGLFTLYQSSR